MTAPDSTFEDRAEQVDEEERPSTWEPEDLSAYLDGTHVPEEPALMPRADGKCLLYAGRVHSLHGESESGKSMIAQAEVARVLSTGGIAAYLDFESDASVVVGRLLQMGVPADAIRDRLHYLRPDANPRSNDRDRIAYTQLLERTYTIAVVDGVTEATVVFGVSSSKDNDEITAWIRNFVRKLAQRTGAAVVMVDHVTKDSDSRGRFAVGAGAKMNALDGSAFVVEVKEPLGVGMRGVVVMRVAKDRPGRVRPQCGKWRASDRTQEAARVVVDSTTEGVIAVTVEPPSDSAADSASGEKAEKLFRPTHLMERVSVFVQGQFEPPAETRIVDGVKGNERHLKKAIECLAEDGYIERRKVGNAWRHHHIKEYLQINDPQSDQYQPPLAEVYSWDSGDSDSGSPLAAGTPISSPAGVKHPRLEEEEIRTPLPPPGEEFGGDVAEMEEIGLPPCRGCETPTSDRNPDGVPLCPQCTCPACGYRTPNAVEHEICCINANVATEAVARFMNFDSEAVAKVRAAFVARQNARKDAV